MNKKFLPSQFKTKKLCQQPNVARFKTNKNPKVKFKDMNWKRGKMVEEFNVGEETTILTF